MAPSPNRKQGSPSLHSQYLNCQPSRRLVRYSIYSVQPTTNPSVPQSPGEDVGRTSEPVTPDAGTARELNDTASPMTPPITFFPRTYNPSVSTPPHLMSPESSSPFSNLDSAEAQAGFLIEALLPSSSPIQYQPVLRSNRTNVIRHTGTIRTAGPASVDRNPSTFSGRPEHLTLPGGSNESTSASRTSSDLVSEQSGPGNAATSSDQSPSAQLDQSTNPPPTNNSRPTHRCLHFEDGNSEAVSDSTESVGASTGSSATEEIPRTNPFPRARLRSERVYWDSVSTVRQVTTRETTVIELWRDQVPRNEVFNDDGSMWRSSGDDTVLSQTESGHFDDESPGVPDQGGVVDDGVAEIADSGNGGTQDGRVMRDQATQTHDEAPVAGGHAAGTRDQGAQTESAMQTTTIDSRSFGVESIQAESTNNQVDKRARQATCEDESRSQARADTVDFSPVAENAAATPAESPSSAADPVSVSLEEVRLGLNPLRLPTALGAELKSCTEHGIGHCPQCIPGYASDNDESDKATPRPYSPSPSFTPGDDAALQRSPHKQSRLQRVRSDLKKRVEAKAEKYLLSTRRRSSRVGRIMPRFARKEIIRLERWAACNMMERRYAKARPQSIPGQLWLVQAEKRVSICEEQERQRKELEQYYEGRLQDLSHEPHAPVKLGIAVLQWARMKFA